MEEEEERRTGTGGGAGREDKARGQDDTLLDLCCIVKSISNLMMVFGSGGRKESLKWSL